ncbi:4-oxalocrotonate tautomerase [Salipaludibacillus agaradhaerens]|jgi:4-oxalocrotonate tautomerase|uniref:Tautomerase n=1 Tax=Salipaludibacillus agaradhaerens TaxID=76935 RepID=A0A9Q4G125_SALAG|nr:2-hydroxymuconate tautomerase [Salipaludibacillus agaradhaerens]MCR6098597.1 4-oxalocrotonate tautomerase [Salipaludibacillus agaradhaerens]MCR6115604.1 4-oxalocrotonate tautomerase [Salipaludibacillus agaradhaerens]UJW59310.1 4-oxalocrotonate tautomerase [Bacillus sp. A116_S68]
MPIVTIKMLEGRTDDQKRALVEKVTEAVTETTQAPAERVSVVIEEMSPAHFGVGGTRASDKA